MNTTFLQTFKILSSFEIKDCTYLTVLVACVQKMFISRNETEMLYKHSDWLYIIIISQDIRIS